MAYRKFEKYLERKDPDLVRKPKIIKTGDKLQGADDLCAEPNKPPKEAKPLKDGKQAQVKEGLWAKFLEKKQGGSVVEKPSTEVVADYPFKAPPSPPEPKTKGKNWDAKAPKASKPLPYKGAGTDPGQQTAKEGLGNLGSIPKEEIKLTAGDSQYIPGGKTLGDYSTKTEAFLKKTKDMSFSEYTQVIKEELNVDGVIHTELPRAIQYIASLSKNENVLRDVVVEFRKQNLVSRLIETLMNYPEAYQSLSRLLGDEQKGLSRCNALVRAMNENIGPPVGLDSMDGEDDEDEPRIRPMDDEDDDEMGDEDIDDMDDEDEDEDEDDEMGCPGPEDELGDEDLGDEDEMGDEEMGDEDEMGLGAGDEEEEPRGHGFLSRSKLRPRHGRFAMDHLVHALSQYLKKD
jgi:hypothetical protein